MNQYISGCSKIIHATLIDIASLVNGYLLVNGGNNPDFEPYFIVQIQICDIVIRDGYVAIGTKSWMPLTSYYNHLRGKCLICETNNYNGSVSYDTDEGQYVYFSQPGVRYRLTESDRDCIMKMIGAHYD